MGCATIPIGSPMSARTVFRTVPDAHIPRAVSRAQRTSRLLVKVMAGAGAAGLIGLCGVPSAAMSSAAPGGDFDWPLRPRPEVVRAFDKPEHDWLPGHRGVDLAASQGQAVLSAGDGIVVFAGTVAGKPVVSIDHPGGLRTTYEPVTASIPVGRRLTRGDPIGLLEPGHPTCSPCLHWGARRNREYLDPLGLLHRTPIRLKPLAAAAISTPVRNENPVSQQNRIVLGVGHRVASESAVAGTVPPFIAEAQSAPIRCGVLTAMSHEATIGSANQCVRAAATHPHACASIRANDKRTTMSVRSLGRHDPRSPARRVADHKQDRGASSLRCCRSAAASRPVVAPHNGLPETEERW